MTMMNEWILAGCVFGIKAFFAVFIFLMLGVALVGLLGLLAGIAKRLGDGGDDLDRR